jgi:heptosyltransferase-2
VLVPWFAGIPKRTGFTGELRYGLLNDRRKLDKTALPMTVQRFVALGLPPAPCQTPDTPTPQLAANATNATHLLAKLELNTDRPVIAFMPGAEYGPAKQWPAPHFAQLAKDLIAQGHQIWILGSGKDHEIAQQITLASTSPHIHNLCGKTQLADVVDLLSVCNAAVSNDSGLMHVAAALDIPLVALYGSSDPKHTPPLSHKAHVLHLSLECSPCFKRQCPLGHTRCLQDITPDFALKALT